MQTAAPDAPGDRRRRPPRHRGLPRRRARAPRCARYPPFADLIRVVCSRRGAGRRAAAAGAWRPARRRAGAAVLGPAPLFRLRGRERFQVVLKTTRRRAAIAAVGAAVDARRATSASRRRLLGRRRPAVACGLAISRWRRVPTRRTARSPRSHTTARSRDPRAPRRGARATCASTAIRCCAAGRWRSTASTTRCARRSRRMGQLMHDALGHRARRHAGRRDAPRARLPRRARGARSPRS